MFVVRTLARLSVCEQTHDRILVEKSTLEPRELLAAALYITFFSFLIERGEHSLRPLHQAPLAWRVENVEISIRGRALN